MDLHLALHVAPDVDALDRAYARCRRLHRLHGRTYYLATRLLPHWKHRHVHALYGLTRYADDLVDEDGAGAGSDRERRLTAFAQRFRRGLADHEAVRDDPILPAVLHTIAVFDLDPADFDAFFRSMAMDLTRTTYRRYEDLLDYMEGSAAVIGTMMLPILGSAPDSADRTGAARESARQLGLAFQLTNFLRDVGEDLDRGRIYLPLEDLDRFGVTRGALRRGEVTPAIRALLEFEIARARAHYAAAEPGIDLLAPSSRACIRAAFTLYGGILDAIARNGFDVFHRRARVPTRRKLAVAARELGRTFLVGQPGQRPVVRRSYRRSA